MQGQGLDYWDSDIQQKVDTNLDQIECQNLTLSSLDFESFFFDFVTIHG